MDEKLQSTHRSQTLFRPATKQTLEEIAQLNSSKYPNFMLNSACVSASAAKLGYVLDQRCYGNTRYVSFFCSSTIEALGGAVKIARHKSLKDRRNDGGWILCLDPGGDIKPFFDPLKVGPEQALCPHTVFVTSPDEADERLPEHTWSAVFISLRSVDGSDFAEAARLAEIAKRHGALAVVCNTTAAPDQELFPPLNADVWVYGENLTSWQVPFGCFTMTEDVYRVWNNPRDSVAHSTTFGGNGYCLSLALSQLRSTGHINDSDESILDRIENDLRTRIDYFGKHVNPQMATGMEMAGLALHIAAAEGSTLELVNGISVLDCACGTGSNLRGHSPKDLTDEVLDTHDVDHDYFTDLTQLLDELTGFPNAYAAVSGASAVDTAVTLALLANPDRRTIVAFKGNYSGKSLASMNLSKYGPTYVESDHDAFRPYYKNLVYIDPFGPCAAQQLNLILERGDVCLVWYELIQGMLCKPIPQEIIELIDRRKGEFGYLVGLDEVLTGGWRAADTFLAHKNRVQQVDVIAISKPLSDITLPIGVALATDEIDAKARQTNGEVVNILRDKHINNLSAHVALHALTKVSTSEYIERRRQGTVILQDGLRAVAENSRLFEPPYGSARHIRLALKHKWFPFSSRSMVGQMLEMTITAMVLNDCRVLTTQMRFFPPLFGDNTDLAEGMERLREGTAHYTPLLVYWNAMRRLLLYSVKSAWRERIKK